MPEMQDQTRRQPPVEIGKPLPGVLMNAWVLSPRASAELRLHGELTHEDLELLRDYVEITIKALGRKAEAYGSVGHPKKGEGK